MGRKRLLMKRIDNPCSHHLTYSKRREGILKKATELSMLCDTDVGLLMIEDIFLRYIDKADDFKGPVNKEESLYQNLKHLKYEAEMLDKIERHSISEADLHQQFVIDTIRRIENLKKEKLLEKETSPSNPNNVKMPAVAVKDFDFRTEESVNSERKRNQSSDDHKGELISPPDLI
ncbi:hypothetical protein PTKIN_Ptkin02bG0130800 [Pterospermum kingtungense]